MAGTTWSDERRDKYLKQFVEFAKQSPSEETKRKMSKAKAGVSKSRQHRRKMQQTHAIRWGLFHDIRETHPEYTKAEVWALVKTLMPK